MTGRCPHCGEQIHPFGIDVSGLTPMQKDIITILANKQSGVREIASAIYGNNKPRSAYRVIVNQILAIRQKLGVGIIETTATGYRLNTGRKSK